MQLSWNILQMNGADMAAAQYREGQQQAKFLFFQNALKLHGMIKRGSLTVFIGYHT